MATVSMQYKDKVAAPKLQSGDFAVGAFGKEIGMLRKGAYGWYWLDSPSELFPNRPEAIDTRVRILISRGALIEDPEFSIQNREPVSDPVKALVRVRDKGTCQHCSRSALGKDERFDHFVPVAFGGPSVAENVLLSCKKCNRDKWHILPWHLYGEQWEDWAPGKPRPQV